MTAAQKKNNDDEYECCVFVRVTRGFWDENTSKEQEQLVKPKSVIDGEGKKKKEENEIIVCCFQLVFPHLLPSFRGESVSVCIFFFIIFGPVQLISVLR